MSQREQQKTESRRAILRSAADAIRAKGIDGTSVLDVMRGAGLTPGAFYAHFADKGELVAEAFSVALADGLALVDGAAGGTSGEQAVVGIVRRYLSQGHAEQPASGCPLPALVGDRAVSPDLIAEGLRALEARVGAAAGREGTLALVTLLIGGQVLARALAGRPEAEEVLAACVTAGERLAHHLFAEAG